ncbi:MAG: RlmE family RNA methyltransferase [Deltaproteobacteria bacterium]|nr:RlmE family RNA methyltransferase [Deltaproteobacteria bacterium]
MPRPGVPDPYRRKARQEGYVSRAVFKLQEIDEKYQLLNPGHRVLDLGCSPGSWMQYSASRVGSSGLVLGIDANPPEIELAPPLYFLAGDVESLDLATVRAVCPEFDAVLSDLAPKTTGVKEVDRQRSLDLALLAWQYARQLLKAGGHFLVKVFEGPDTPALVKELQAAFASCRIVKPAGSRAASREIYLLGLKKRAR